MIALVQAIFLHFLLRRKPFANTSLEAEERIDNEVWKDQIWISSI